MTREEARQKLIDIIDWHVQDALERMCLELDVDEYYDALDTLYDGPKGNMISRDDAIAAVTMAALEDKDEIEALKALPSVQVSGDLISRADAIEAVKETKPIVRSTERNWGKMIADEHSKELVKALKALPSADAVKYESTVTLNSPISISAEAVQGEWGHMIADGSDGSHWYEYECSHCGEVVLRPYNFCPNCGAEMYKGEDTTGESL